MNTDELDEYLRQADCPGDIRARVERLVGGGHADEGLLSLAEYRVCLLDQLHTADHRLSCLDRVISDIMTAM